MLGAIFGAVAGLLLAPKSGQEMRADLMEQSEAWRVRAEEVAARAREHVGPALEGARERLAPAVEEIRERVGPVVGQVGSSLVSGARGEGAGENGGSGDRRKT